MQDFEILAPVKDEENFEQAINNGADAVYLGLTDFNARQKASTFDKESLVRAVDKAHFFGVKVYVVLNTIIVDDEFDKLVELAKMAVDAKVDAFIVQDLGVAKVLKSCFKNISLHASTQLGVHNLAGAKVCEKLGFSRVVLSREATLEDIKQIKKHTNLEIEYFVQGALCVAFSGACYLSSVKHSCSGNRGKCLQLCRLCYTAIDNNVNKKGYFLSPTDLSFLNNLKMLHEAGVTSFKIEGRLRRPSYVALATRSFSYAKNCILSCKDFNSIQLKKQLQKVFYRGEYNDGLYFEEEPNKNIINSSFQNHRGILIGKVLSVKPFKDIYEILVKTSIHEIVKNDGLKFVSQSGVEISMGVGSVKSLGEGKFVLYSKIKPNQNDDMYLTVDYKWEEQLLKSERTRKFNAVFCAETNKKPKLILSCGEVEVEEQLDFVLSNAQTQALKCEEVRACLNKTNEFPFSLEKLQCKIDNIFMPKAKLNELRRKAIEKLFFAVVSNYNNKNIKNVDFCCEEYLKLKNLSFEQGFNANKSFLCVDEKIIFDKNFEKQASNYLDWSLVLAPQVFEIKNIEKCFEMAKNIGFNNLYLDLPKVARGKDFEKVFKIVQSLAQEIKLVANNIYGLYFAMDEYSAKREVVGGVYLNIANSFSAKVLDEFNIKCFVKSFEHFASDFDKGLNFEGKPALMTFCHCPYKTIYQNSLCKDCKFTNSLKLKNDSQEEFKIRRKKIDFCTFELVDTKPILNYNVSPKYVDLRENF